jgi:uncharacterized protein (DUF58 family)
MIKRYISDLYFNNRWYLLMGAVAILFCISFFIPLLFTPAILTICTLLFLTLLDYILLFSGKGHINAQRVMAARFSLGDNNTIKLLIHNTYVFKAHLLVIDELPIQFQDRNFRLSLSIKYSGRNETSYTLRPLTRGEYEFGDLICFVKTPLQLLQRRFKPVGPTAVKVYPSYLQLKKYQLLALSDNLITGVKKIRRLGHSLEFEKIKDYVPGDDVRTINWKATARTGSMMVNTYTDTRQQQVYCIIDKGRAMKMPFEGMSLLDYAVNATLVISNVALLKHDKAGLITFSNKVNDIVAAERRTHQLNLILETLYKQQTDFKESDYEGLGSIIHRRITQRSLLLFFTNFETYSSLERQLPFLSQMSARHLVCVVFFQNTLLKDIYETQPDDLEGIYIKTVAQQFDFEKRQIVKQLRTHGILSILTTPQNLSIDVINKYLELKARQMI